MVAHRPSKPFVAGSNPVSRSYAGGQSCAESFWGNQELSASLAEPTCSLEGEPCRTRTCDTLLKRQVLCQLS
jgi:hypothetical protein